MTVPSDHPEASRPDGATGGVPPATDAALRRIADALRGIRFGSVLAIVQDGVVVQVERTEKIRFSR